MNIVFAWYARVKHNGALTAKRNLIGQLHARPFRSINNMSERKVIILLCLSYMVNILVNQY